MNKRLVPFARAKSIYDIPLTFYKENGIKIILADLDNTLDSAKTLLPSKRACTLKENLEKEGIRIAIASNNTSKRVYCYAKELGVKAYCGLCKPFSWKLKKLTKKEKFNLNEVVFIGDQLMTDAKASSGAKIRFILVEPLTKEEPLRTKFNRLFEKRPRRKLDQVPYVTMWRKIS